MPLRDKSGTQQVGQTDSGRTGAQEQILLVLQLRALELGCVDHAGKRYAGRALHIVVVDAVLVAVALEQVDGIDAGPVLEVNAALRKHLLHRLDELVDEGIEIVGGGTSPAQTQIQRIVQILLVVGPCVEIHGQ